MFKIEWEKHHDITFSFQFKPRLSLLKSVYLVLLFLLILSALIYKSIHFKQPESKSLCCPSRSWERCILEMHWNSSYKYSEKPKGNLDPDANFSVLFVKNAAWGKTSHVFKCVKNPDDLLYQGLQPVFPRWPPADVIWLLNKLPHLINVLYLM